MSILVFGSLNIDHVYQVEHLVRLGETLPSTAYRRFQGGKGANQSVALARAGAPVFHAGRVGREGMWLRDELAVQGVDVAQVAVGDVPTGHAIIQVDRDGENAILLYGGANLTVSGADARGVLAQFGPGDWLLLQNEISAMPDILRAAAARGLLVAFNPAPMTPEVQDYPLDGVSLFVVNETEGAALAGIENASPASIVGTLQRTLSACRDTAHARWRRFPLCARRRAHQNASASGRGGGHDCRRRHLHRLFSGRVAGWRADSASPDHRDQGGRALRHPTRRGCVNSAPQRTWPGVICP